MKVRAFILFFVALFFFSTNGMSAPISSDFVKKVIIAINKGNPNVLKKITYPELKYVFEYSIYHFGQIPFSKRGKVVNAALKGLFNKEPRVRLICIEILRSMKPDRLMEPEVKIAYKSEIEENLSINRHTDDFYQYHNLYGVKVKKSMKREITHLYQWVRRDKLVHILLQKNPYLLKKINKEDFLILSSRIDNEKDDIIPLRSVGKSKIINPGKIEYITFGLDNPNIAVQRGCARYLIHYYNTNAPYLEVHYRNLILKALKAAYDNDVIAKPRLVKLRRY